MKHTLTDIKLASLVIHAQEFLSPDGHELDRHALLSLTNDPDIAEWLKKFDPALLPVKRHK